MRQKRAALKLAQIILGMTYILSFTAGAYLCLIFFASMAIVFLDDKPFDLDGVFLPHWMLVTGALLVATGTVWSSSVHKGLFPLACCLVVLSIVLLWLTGWHSTQLGFFAACCWFLFPLFGCITIGTASAIGQCFDALSTISKGAAQKH